MLLEVELELLEMFHSEKELPDMVCWMSVKKCDWFCRVVWKERLSRER